jgi:hypothetical protein
MVDAGHGPFIDARPGPLGDGGTGSLDAAPADASTDGCAIAPMGEWVGTAMGYRGGAGGGEETRVDVRWSLVATEGCVDRYAATGTVFFAELGQCDPIVDPPSAAIDPGDGELIIDRSTSPATFQIRGTSTYPADSYCTGSTPTGVLHDVGGRWANSTGSFDGTVIGGSTYDYDSFVMTWDLRRADAVFTQPGAECSEPTSEVWRTVAHHYDAVATVTWTRASTEGCVDRFAPSGTLELSGWSSGDCTYTYEPSSGPITGAYEEQLIIDRSTDPATFQLLGSTLFDTTLRCTRSDGSTVDQPTQAGVGWARSIGTFDGNHFSGAWILDDRSGDWTIDRGP